MTWMGKAKNFLSGERVDATSTLPYLLKIRSSKIFIIFTIAVAVFTDIFLYGIIVPVIPFALSDRSGVPENQVQKWVSVLLSVYGGALLVGSPISGWWADKSPSRRAPLLVGLLALAGATFMLCLAKSVVLMVVGRILQGLAAAVVWTVGTALLVDTVGEKAIGETLGWVGTSMGVGFLLAPLLGGVVYEKAGYYAVYYMAFALIAIDIILRLALIEKKIAVQWTDPEWSSDDPIIQPRGSGGSLTLETGEEENRMAADLSAPCSDGSAANGRATSRATSRASRLPPVLTLLASRRLLTALWGCVVQGSLMTAFDSVVPLFVQETFGWTSTGAGLIFLAITVPSFISPFIGYLSDTYGPRWLTVFGFLFAIPFWILLRLITHNTLSQKVLFCALLALIGVALAFVLPPLMAEITYVVEAKEREIPGRFGKTGAYASAYGLFIAAFAAGTLIGPVWSGYVRDGAGWGTMSWSLGLFSFAGAVPCLFWTGGNLYDRKSEASEDSGEDEEVRVGTATASDQEAARSDEKIQAKETATARMEVDHSVNKIKQDPKE